MKAEQLRKSILQLAIQGKLVPQNPADEPASVLLERIRAEKQRLIKEGKIKKDKGDSVIFKGDDNCYYEKTGLEVKNITDEIDFDLPDGWECIRLSTVCWLGDTKKTSGETLPYLDAKTLRGKTDIAYLNEGKIVDYGTKVILVDGENSGEVFNVPFRGYMGSTFKILGASKEFNIHYLNTILDFYKDVFRDSKIGAAIPHLNKSLFKSLIIGLPPLAEQERIVAEIEKFEPLIAEYDKLEQQATKLDGEIYDKLKKSILQYAIQGNLVPQNSNDEPASVLLERIRAEKKAQLGKKYVDSYIYKGDDNCYYEHINGKDIDITEDIPFDLPNEWAWARLINLCIDISDIDHNMPKSVENGVLFLSAKDLLNDGSINYTNNVKYISEEDYVRLSGKSKPQKGDIIYSRIGACLGKARIVKEDIRFLVSYSCCTIKPVLINKEYLRHILDDVFVLKQAKKKTQSIGVPDLGIAEIKKFRIPIPPLNEQKRIVEKIDEIFAKL